jgi:hypothetical protein
MKHVSIRELFEYWNDRRGLRAAPERWDIEPGAIRRVLADTFILAFDGRTGHPFRIAGTRVCAAFGQELRGRAFADLWTTESRRLISDLLTLVSQEGIGAVASARGNNIEGQPLDFELLLLPLGYRGRLDARVLGALAPTDVPYWFGLHTLEPLTLGTLRYLGPWLASGAAPHGVPAPSSGRARRGLTIFDGGRS